MKFDANKHIIFKKISQTMKTKIYEVWNTQEDCPIGIVRWCNAWRHYWFLPYPETGYSDRCMFRIGKFVEDLNKKHFDKWREKNII
jgi:hypothetical protein